MTAIADRAIDPALHALRDRLADLPELELRSFGAVGRGAEDAMDRLRGRSRRRRRPWLLGGALLIGLVMIIAISVVGRSRTRKGVEANEAVEDVEAVDQRTVDSASESSVLTNGPATNGTGRAGDPNQELTAGSGSSAAGQPRLSHQPAEPQEA